MFLRNDLFRTLIILIIKATGYHSFSFKALDPWLCVLNFHLVYYFLLLYFIMFFLGSQSSLRFWGYYIYYSKVNFYIETHLCYYLYLFCILIILFIILLILQNLLILHLLELDLQLHHKLSL